MMQIEFSLYAPSRFFSKTLAYIAQWGDENALDLFSYLLILLAHIRKKNGPKLRPTH